LNKIEYNKQICMKKYFSAFILSSVYAVSTISASFIPRNANAQSSPRPYVVLVNGNNDCCAWDMDTALQGLKGADFTRVPWNTFRNGANQASGNSNDKAFLDEAANFINNRLDPNRPLIMIGHSFGGDSLLSLAPRIKRRIQFLGVIDPTAAGGVREPITRREIPSNVDYFFNRWQRNGANKSNIVPFDSRLFSGNIAKCRAKSCDQQEQNLARKADGSETRVSCEAHEASCTGWRLPGCNFRGCWKGSNGTKAKRLGHNDMPNDEYIRSQITARTKQIIANYKPPSTTPTASTNNVCVTVDSKKGWQDFNLNGSFTKVASISGGWSVDTRNYSPVGASGHTGRDAESLAPYEQYKFDQDFPFGTLLVNIPNYGYINVQQPQQLPQPVSKTAIRINDADNALGDNGGSLKVCFGK
jgi:hypothetical protein